MSGGHWDYSQHRIRAYIQDVGMDGEVVLRFPKIAQIFREVAELLSDTIQTLDKDISGDSNIDSPKEFEETVIKQLGNIISKKYKVRIYDVEE